MIRCCVELGYVERVGTCGVCVGVGVRACVRACVRARAGPGGWGLGGGG
jgi:hypothetical protein